MKKIFYIIIIFFISYVIGAMCSNTWNLLKFSDQVKSGLIMVWVAVLLFVCAESDN